MHLSTMIDWRHALLGVVLTLACSLAGQSLAALPGFSLIGHLVLALLLGMVIQVCRPSPWQPGKVRASLPTNSSGPASSSWGSS